MSLDDDRNCWTCNVPLINQHDANFCNCPNCGARYEWVEGFRPAGFKSKLAELDALVKAIRHELTNERRMACHMPPLPMIVAKSGLPCVPVEDEEQENFFFKG